MTTTSEPRGFTLVEALVAVVLIALVGMAMGRVIAVSTYALGFSRDQQKASTLGEMVLEQYAAFAANDASTLSSFDKNLIAPRDFFHTADDLGYERMRISTLARPAANGTGSEVSVTVSWGQASEGKTLTLSKFFSDGDLSGSGSEAGSGI